MTAKIEPSWMIIKKLFQNSSISIPKIVVPKIICPVEEIGKNSVRPSIIPSIKAYKFSILILE